MLITHKTATQMNSLERAREILRHSDTVLAVGRRSPADRIYNKMVYNTTEFGEVVEPDHERTGTGTVQIFGEGYKIPVGQSFPIITTKKVFFDSVVAEVLWYLSGESHINNLKEHTQIWNEWADARGYLETAYGRYWRNYPQMGPRSRGLGEAKSKVYHNHFRRGEHGIDQIRRVVENIQDNPHSRRHVVTAWHPDNAWDSKLPPCHFAFVFHAHTDGRLSLELHQRSGDVALGIPFNMAGYAFLLHLVARETGREVGYLKHNITNAHVYLNHVETLAKQVTRTPTNADVTLEMDIGDRSMFDLTLDDVDKFTLSGYEHRDPVRYEVAV